MRDVCGWPSRVQCYNAHSTKFRVRPARKPKATKYVRSICFGCRIVELCTRYISHVLVTPNLRFRKVHNRETLAPGMHVYCLRLCLVCLHPVFGTIWGTRSLQCRLRSQGPKSTSLLVTLELNTPYHFPNPKPYTQNSSQALNHRKRPCFWWQLSSFWGPPGHSSLSNSPRTTDILIKY